jgi:signal recognition particle receptor subunit beta
MGSSSPQAAGKTMAIRAISHIEPVSTDVTNNDRVSHSKA